MAAPLGARQAAAEMAPSAVALAVFPPAAKVMDLQAAENRGDTVWPTRGWLTSTPEEQGLDSRVLANAIDTIRIRQLPVHSLLIVRHGRIVLDTYFAPFADNELHDAYSVTKSVVSTLVGIAVRQRRMPDLRTPVLAMLPDAVAEADPLKQRMTLGHLLSMTSGLNCRGNSSGNFLQAMQQSRHWAQFALERDEVAEPGTTFAYCAGNMHVISAALTRSVGQSAAEFARRELFEPLGIEHVSWASDRDGVSHGFAGLRMQPRDMAKLGYLWLHHGEWDGRQIVPASYLRAAFTPHADVEQNVKYGYGMWIYPYRGHAGGAPDIEANGFGGQRIAVIPSQDMVVVITGAGLDANKVASLLVGAVKSDAPLQPNLMAQARLDSQVSGHRHIRELSSYASFSKRSLWRRMARHGYSMALASR